MDILERVMFHFPDDPHSDDKPEHPDLQREQANALHEKYSDLEDELRKIGLYAEDRMIALAPTGEVCMIVDCVVGDVAFKPLVQDPEGDSFERQFRAFEAGTQIDGFLDVRQQMIKDIDAAG